MPDPEMAILSRAKRQVPANPEVRDCWSLVLRGLEIGWLNDYEIRDLLEHLRAHRDFGIEELLFANLGDRLRVSFLDDVCECSPAQMIQELTALIAP